YRRPHTITRQYGSENSCITDGNHRRNLHRTTDEEFLGLGEKDFYKPRADRGIIKAPAYQTQKAE
ncbi:hypothetical protein, partial [Acetobacter senegalensis]|uniref:hypothetical protein n=1 Tax=Acetobacter senegalensis TaxID=446692 RepID=UPI001EE080F2